MRRLKMLTATWLTLGAILCAATLPAGAEPPVAAPAPKVLAAEQSITPSFARLEGLQTIDRRRRPVVVRPRPRPPVVVVRPRPRPPVVVVRPGRYRPWRPGLRYAYWTAAITVAAGNDIGWCHVHRYASGGMVYHRDVRCHRHSAWNSPAIRYVYAN